MKKEKAKFKHRLMYVIVDNLPESQEGPFRLWLAEKEKPKPVFEENKTCAFYDDYLQWFSEHCKAS